jgi:hypothetical protein
MTSPIDVSTSVPNIQDIWNHYQACKERLQFKKDLILSFLRGDVDGSVLSAHGISISPLTSSSDVTLEFNQAMRELDYLVKFNLLSSVEGHARYDFAVRINNGGTDPLSTRFSRLYGSQGSTAKKVQYQGSGGILESWIDDLRRIGDWKNALIQNYVDVLELRHWLAHGRWWNLEPAVDLPVSEIKDIVENALDAMGLP